MKKTTERYLKKKGDFDIELAIGSEILKLSSLHYGYWLENEKPTLSEFAIAQSRYTEFVYDQIPKGVKTILDVGAGLGCI